MTPGYTEEWFSPASQDCLRELVRVVRDIPGMILEIGAWEGRSTAALAAAAHPRIVHTVDTWDGSPGEISAKLAGERDVHAQFLANIDAFTDGNVEAHRMGWREFVPTVDEPVALAFIDAEHSYAEVRDNVEALIPKMAPGGIICGDDAHHGPVQEALFDVFGKSDVLTEASIWIWQAPPPPQDLGRLYATAASTPSDINEHLPRFVALVESVEARHVIELGSRTGISTIGWLYGLERTGGRLTSIDLDPKPPIGAFDHWTFIRGDDEDDEVFDRLEPADIVFIDTSHEYGHTCRELDRYLPLASKLMVLHDTEVRHPMDVPIVPAYPVKKAVSEFCDEHGFEWVNFPACNGLAVIKVGWP